MKPIIGITAMANADSGIVYRCNQDYVHAILDAGGIPILLPACGGEVDYAALVDRMDGLLIPGGGDVAPMLYGEEAIAQVTYTRRADDTFEFALIRAAAAQGKPILGICRGIQVINAAFGGTLWQDIPSQFPSRLCHRQTGPRYEPFHYVQLEPGSAMAALYGCLRLEVNSFHHQAVKDVAPGFRVSGRSSDGLIEAMEHESQYILGVQWHPEGMIREHPVQQALFRDFVAKAAR